MPRVREGLDTRLAVVAIALLAAACGPSDAERREQWRAARAEWQAVEPHAYAYWFRCGDMEGSYSVRVEIVGGEVVRSDVGDERSVCRGPSAPEIDDMYGFVDRAFADAARDPGRAEVRIDRDDRWGFPTLVHFSGSAPDHFYVFEILGFQVSELRRDDP